jgi:aminoglycoside phosphotransferase (APT) family kinase protein
VGETLLTYLRSKIHISGLEYALSPAPVVDGWETYMYAFRLQADSLPPLWDRPLMLRIHVSSQATLRVEREFIVPEHLLQLGYPVPEPLLMEREADLFGGPFLIMEEVAGQSLMRAMLGRPWKLFHLAGSMAKTHARLHEFPTADFPSLEGTFHERHFSALRSAIAPFSLDGLTSGLDWLETHQPSMPESASILHMDYHPLNLIVRADGSLAVLDWTYADLGDPHCDVGMTMMLLETVPASGDHLGHRLAIGIGRPAVAWWYLHSYRRHRPLDQDRLNYYRAWSALHQLVRYGRRLRAEPEESDCKPSTAEYLGPRVIDSVCRYFQRWSGVPVGMG